MTSRFEGAVLVTVRADVEITVAAIPGRDRDLGDIVCGDIEDTLLHKVGYANDAEPGDAVATWTLGSFDVRSVAAPEPVEPDAVEALAAETSAERGE